MPLVWADGRVHARPDLLTEEQKRGSILVDEVPEPERILGKAPVMRVDMEAGRIWYEYVDAPDTDPEVLHLRLQDVEKRLKALEDKGKVKVL